MEHVNEEVLFSCTSCTI